jgi:hypothetical protein
VTTVDVLFEEFVSRWARDEAVNVTELLERAGPETDELARLIDEFLARAPRREPTEESRAAVAAIAARLEREPPLLAARVAARKRVRDVSAAIVLLCGLPDEAEALVRSYYQRLEGGLLDPGGVSERVWSALEHSFGAAVRALAVQSLPPKRLDAAESVAFGRLASADLWIAPAAAAPVPPDEPAEAVRRQVEELFTGGAKSD